MTPLEKKLRNVEFTHFINLIIPSHPTKLPTAFPSNKPPHTKAFRLVEIMIVVVIIGLLAAMAIPAFNRIQERSRHTALANDLRAFAHAFETYALANGGFPADSNIGVILPAMAGGASSLDTGSFAAVTPIGGHYKVFRIEAAVSVANATISEEQRTRFDATFDDGNLATGNYRSSTGRYAFILQLN